MHFLLLVSLILCLFWRAAPAAGSSSDQEFFIQGNVGQFYQLSPDGMGGATKFICAAHGKCKVSTQFKVMLKVSEAACRDLAWLDKLPSDSIAGISFAYCPLGNDSLRHLARFRKLQFIDLSGTEITDAGLVHLRTLSNLQSLRLNEAEVDGTGLRHLPQVRWLQIARTNVTDRSIESLSVLHLKGIDMSGNRLTHKCVPHIVNHRASLESLIINRVPLRDSGARELVQLVNLTCLSLENLGITDAGVENLARLKKLKILRLGENKISDKSVETICRLSDLTALDLHLTGVLGDNLDKLKECKSLYMLGLSETDVGDAAVKKLAKLPMSCLSLSFSRVSDASIPVLEQMKGLRELSLVGTCISAAGKARLQKNLPQCRIIK